MGVEKICLNGGSIDIDIDLSVKRLWVFDRKTGNQIIYIEWDDKGLKSVEILGDTKFQRQT